MMKTMQIGEFKAQFSQVVEWVKQGIQIRIIKGRSGEVVGYFRKDPMPESPRKVTLGFLEAPDVDVEVEDLQWSEKELNEMGL